MKAILVITGIIFCFVFAGFASAGDFTQYRGASLDNPLHANWAFAASFWSTSIWPDNKTAKDEVHEYLDRMQSDGFNAVRKLLWVTSDVDWSPATQANLCEFLDMVQEHHMKAMIWIVFVVPSHDDDSKGDPNGNDGKIMPDGSVPSPCLRQRSDNPALFDAVVAQGKRDADKIIGYVAAKRPAHPTIIGWSVTYKMNHLSCQRKNDRALTRRRVLQGAVAAGASMMLGGFARADEQKASDISRHTPQPNLVFIMSDQQSHDMLGCYGNEQILTPNADRLASEGVCFNHCVSSSPICTPYRGMLMSGQHSLHNGAFYNDIQLLPGHGSYIGETGKS
ncbi:MAG: sulfatase-like hydrolase/transferase [Armatimonadota bacterium]